MWPIKDGDTKDSFLFQILLPNPIISMHRYGSRININPSGLSYLVVAQSPGLPIILLTKMKCVYSEKRVGFFSAKSQSFLPNNPSEIAPFHKKVNNHSLSIVF